MVDKRTLACTADARIYEPNLGAGESDVLPVGLWSGAVYRSLAKFAMPDWTELGVLRITKATLRLVNSSGQYVGRGGSPRIVVRRLTEGWSEGNADTLSTSNAVTWANQPASTSAGEATSGALPEATGAVCDIDITDIVRAWAPTAVEGGGGQKAYGVRIRSYDEAATSRTTEFRSRETSSPPRILLEYETNTKPRPPVSVSPATTDGAPAVAFIQTVSVRSALGSPVVYQALRFSGTRDDPDAGDWITSVEIAVYADTVSEANVAGATRIAGQVFAVGTVTSYAVDLPVAGLTVGTTYRYRVRTADKAGAWGDWTLLEDGRFIPDHQPQPPTNRAVDTATLTPNFYGSLDDPDTGATLGAARVLVYQDTTAGAIQKWDSGWETTSGTRFTLAYGGSALEYGVRYRWAAQVRDNIGAESALSPYSSWTPVATTGPDGMTPRTIETKQNTLTPTLTVGHSQAFTNHELQVARVPDPADAGDQLWYPAVGAAYTSTTSKAVVYAGTALRWGRTFYWRARVQVGGTAWTEWSPWYPFYINAEPNAPFVSVLNGVENQFSTGTRWIAAPSLTPTIVAPFSDPDIGKGYAEAPSRREIAIMVQATGLHVSGSPFVITTGITDNFVVPAGALTADVTYSVIVRYDDSGNRRSAWGGVQIKPSLPPTVALTTPSSGGTTTDPTPTLDWSFSSPAGKAQRKFRIRLYRQR